MHGHRKSDVINRGLFDTVLLAHFKMHSQLSGSFHTVINIHRQKKLSSNNIKTGLNPQRQASSVTLVRLSLALPPPRAQGPRGL